MRSYHSSPMRGNIWNILNIDEYMKTGLSALTDFIETMKEAGVPGSVTKG